jgi:hypothetical protein
MLFKDIDSKKEEINQLKNLLSLSKNPKQQALIKADLTRIVNGYKAEKENAYYLNFGFKESPRNIILHDIRIEHEGKVAQIDHIIINRFGIEVLESKSFTGILTIKGDGSLNVAYENEIQTFPNPIEQNNRHTQILSNFLKAKIELPTNHKLFGIPISSTVLINPKTTISDDTLPKGFDRADSFTTHWDESVNKMGTIEVFKTLGGIMTMERVKEIANFLVKNHKPKSYDFSKKYPLVKKETPAKPNTQIQPMKMSIKKSVLENPSLIKNQDANTPLCSKCKSPNIEIVYGKYGYYFKCLFCNGNTAIKLTCSNSNCKPKLKKSRLNFYHTCESCGKNELFFVNREKVFS